MRIWIRSVVSSALLSFAYACSSAPPPAPEYPELLEAQAQLNAAKSAAKPAPTKSVAKVAVKPAPATDPSAQGDGLRKASRPPVELLTNSNAIYILNFDASDAGKVAKENCEATGEDRNEISACVQKARSKVPIESERFVKKGSEYWWITFNRYKGNLLKWHIIQFQVGEEKSDWVALKPTGKDKGLAPMPKIPRTLEIELPNDFSIVLNDPEFGKLIFDAKIGMMDE